jgi:hypothetical protein
MDRNRDEIRAAAIHESGHAIAALTRGPGYRVVSLELFPSANGCDGVTKRLTRAGLMEARPWDEALIRLCGPVSEMVLAAGCGFRDTETDLVEAGALVSKHFPRRASARGGPALKNSSTANATASFESLTRSWRRLTGSMRPRSRPSFFFREIFFDRHKDCNIDKRRRLELHSLTTSRDRRF